MPAVKPAQISTPQQPLVSLRTQAIDYYLHDHLHTFEDAPDLVKGVWDNLLPIWRARDEGSILDLAVASIALAVFSRARDHAPAAIEASEIYHKLLQLTQESILALNENSIDICLLAIFFMGRYEQVVHCPISSHIRLQIPVTQIVHAFSHHDGSLAILKSWEEHLSRSLPATDVIKRTRRGTIRSALLRDIALPEWILSGQAFGEASLELEYDRLIVKIACIRQKSKMLLAKDVYPPREPGDVSLEATELTHQLKDVDKDLQEWSTHFPRSWSYQKHTLSGSRPYPTEDFYSSTVFTYSNFGHASIWNLYFGTKILINATRLKILRLSLPSLATHRELTQCVSVINEMADNLAASVPYCREKISITKSPDSASISQVVEIKPTAESKPYMTSLTVWPMSLATCFGGVDEEHKKWFRKELGRSGRMLCDRVLEYAETDQWIEL